jgi:hypothetical protein
MKNTLQIINHQIEIYIMETLGSLCDKLTIVKLKQWHSEDKLKLQSLELQEKQLVEEIDSFIVDAFSGVIPSNKLKYSSNKVYKVTGNEIRKIEGDNIGNIFAELAGINCALWHEQEKIYDIENIAVENKDEVFKNLSKMNLERTFCIDKIDTIIYNKIVNKTN